MKNNILIIAILFSFSNLFSQQIDTSGIWKLNSQELSETVNFLASPELKGRLGGSVGYYMAAEFMAKEFIELGLKPVSKGSYFQNFYVEYNDIFGSCNFNLIKQDKIIKSYLLGTDYVCRGFTGSGHIKSQVVFCGYGISENGYDDFNGIDVKDKIVLMFKTNPDWKLDNVKWVESLRRKANLAKYNGAAAVLFVPKPNDKFVQKPIGSVMDGDGIFYEDFPMIQIDVSIAKDLLEGTGYSLSDLQTKIDNDKKPFSLTTNNHCEIEVNSKYYVNRNTMNVVGLLEGSDPILKNEYVIIGAHLDHVGSQAGKIYFPGANDNASGSAAVLQIARAFKAYDIKPKRSVLFILFSNEESGLEGAKFYVKNPLMPLENTVCMFNMDCIADGDSIMYGNGLSAVELWQMAKAVDSNYINQLVHRTWAGGGADAQPFHDAGIPCMYVVTTNNYKHLHLTSDKPETLNMKLFEKAVRLTFLMAKHITDGNYSREVIRLN